jgi:hypothetical protein
MLAQLAARLRQQQAGVVGPGDDDHEGEGAAIVVDDNCAVGHHVQSRGSPSSCANPPWQIM